MNIWDSMHKGLEKASQEAARIGKIQRLRSTIDKLTAQLSEQESALLNRTMQLFHARTLSQPELIPLCQELVQVHQQLVQAKNELQQAQVAPSTNPPTPIPGGAPPPPPTPSTYTPSLTPPPPTTPINAPSQPTYPSQASVAIPIDPALPVTAPPPPPPSYPTYSASTTPPPPPPGIQSTSSTQETPLLPAETPPPPPPVSEPLTISARETVLMPGGSSVLKARPIPSCPRCNAPILPEHLFCPRCGSSVQAEEEAYQRTRRAEALGDNETVRAETTNVGDSISTTSQPVLPEAPVPVDSDETIRRQPGTGPGSQSHLPNSENDGGI